jgi:ankyrin repeat protein
METDEEIRHALDGLPKDLSETFSRILQRSNKSDSPYQKWILELVTVAQRPLTAEELQEALSVTPGETNWNSYHRLNNIYHALEYCGGLVILDEEELTLHLVHHSFRQYLITKTNGSTAKGFYVENAHQRMSDIIITYLHTVDINRKAVTKEVFPELGAESVMTGIINSTRSSLHGSNKLALKLLRSKSPLELNMGKTLAQAWNMSHRREDHYVFRDYAYAFWHVHITWSLPLSAQFESLLQRLCEKKILSPISSASDLQDLFLKAVSTGSTELTRHLLQAQDLNVNCRTGPDQRTALHIAVNHGFINIINVLLTSDTVDVEATDRNEESPLELAARIGSTPTILAFIFFITAGQINCPRYFFSSLLLRAAKDGDDFLLTQLLELDDNDILHELMLLDWILIREATERGHVTIVELILRVAGTFKHHMPGTNPLHVAVELGQESIITILLRSGKIDCNAVNEHGWSPICLAIFHGKIPILRMLLNCALPSYQPVVLYNGVTPLHLAAAIGDLSKVEILLASSRDNLRFRDSRGNTPLHSAVRCDFNGMVEAVTALHPKIRGNYAGLPSYDITIARHFEIARKLAHDPDFAYYLNWRNDEGDTALHLAARFGHHKFVELLTDISTVDPNQKNDRGYTALHFAAEYGHDRVVELLAKVPRVDLNPTSYDGRKTPLMLAIEFGQIQVVGQLLQLSSGDSVE